MPAEKFSYALNTRLPQDIRIQDSCQVPEDFHPRFQETIKTYEYKIYNRQFPDPTKRLYTYFYYYPLDVEKMRQGAAYLIGEHDFKSFCSIHTQAETTVRTIYRLDVIREGDMIRIRVTGNGFLYNMARAMVGTAVYAAEGKIPPESIGALLEAGNRTAAGPTVPACGLAMTQLWYDDGEVSFHVR